MTEYPEGAACTKSSTQVTLAWSSTETLVA